MTIPAFVFWCLAFWAIVSRGNLYVYLPWLCFPFGALAVLTPSLSLGSTILPATVAFVIFVGKTASRRECRALAWQAATDMRALAPFAVFSLYAVISGFACPRLFAGHLYVIPLRAEYGDRLVPLEPTSANITQSAYTLLAFLVALATLAYLKTGDVKVRRQTFLRSLYAGGAVLAATGLIDLLGGKQFLEIFRNGTYAIFKYSTVGDFGRITGAFPEASAFGGTTAVFATFLYFAKDALQEGMLKRVVAPMVAYLLILLAVLSASSTALVGIAFLSLCIMVQAFFAVVSVGMTRNLIGVFLLAAALSSLCLIVLFQPQILETPANFLDVLVFQKYHSDSYVERHLWTSVGYRVFWQSWGIGAGAGSVRVSSWPASVASNLGIIGCASMAAQVLLTLFLRVPSRDDPAMQSLSATAKAGLIAILAMGYFSGTNLDPGPLMGVAFALALVSSHWFAARTYLKRPQPLWRVIPSA